MSFNSIGIPPDSYGKKVRTWTTVQSGATVHQHYQIPSQDYDYILLTYATGNLTGVAKRIGGSSGTLIQTITLGYTANATLKTVAYT